MAKNLTTLYLFKLHAGISVTTDDTLNGYLIDQVSQAIATWCGRRFEATTYLSWLDGSGTCYMTVPEWPIVTLYGVSYQTQVAATIKNTGAKWASVSTKDGTLYLDEISSAAAETHTEITLSGKTITGLETAVEAVSGWSMEVYSGFGSEPALLLKPMGGIWCLHPDHVDLELPDQLEPVSLAPEGNQTIVADSFSGFPVGRQNVMVWYKAGYTLPVDNEGHTAISTAGNVPDDLMLIANEIVRTVYDSTKQHIGVLSSESTQTYSYSIRAGAEAIIAEQIGKHASALSRYRSMKV